jgi:hypothetical protein
MLSTFGSLLIDGQAIADEVPVWLEEDANSRRPPRWSGTILVEAQVDLAPGSQAALRLQDGRIGEVRFEQSHPGPDGGVLLRFKGLGALV